MRSGRQTFEKYQLTPEYQLVNKGMGLDEFQADLLWEILGTEVAWTVDRASLFSLRSCGSLARRDIPAESGAQVLGIFGARRIARASWAGTW
jgi:hypothetical protein